MAETSQHVNIYLSTIHAEALDFVMQKTGLSKSSVFKQALLEYEKSLRKEKESRK